MIHKVTESQPRLNDEEIMKINLALQLKKNIFGEQSVKICSLDYTNLPYKMKTRGLSE